MERVGIPILSFKFNKGTTMKKILFVAFALAAVFSMTSCSEEEKNTKFEPLSSLRNIDVDMTSASASETMSAYIKLPKSLEKYIQEEDEFVALAFVNNDYLTDPVRGNGEIIKDTEGNPIFKMLIYGNSSEQTNLYFVYYSSRNKYLYKTDAYLAFTPEGEHGSWDEPYEIKTKIIK